MRTLNLTQTAESRNVLLGSEWPEVLRIASELYAKDRLEIERASRSQQLKQAAAEVGLPPEYLERAAMALEAERTARSRRRLTRWRRVRVASALAVTLTLGWASVRLTAPAPTVVPAQTIKRLAGRNLRGANLAGEDLAGRDLSMACLRGAVLTDINLRGANLNGADLRGADLTGADVSGAEMVGALFDDSTRWPRGFKPEAYHVRVAR